MKSLRLFTEFKGVIGRNFYPAICWFLFSQKTGFIFTTIFRYFSCTPFWPMKYIGKSAGIFHYRFCSANLLNFFIILSFLSSFHVLEWPWLERGNPWARAARYTVSHGKQVTEIFRYRHYLAPKMSGTISGKKPEMFRPIAVRNQLTTPYGRKVLGNLKQPILTKCDN